MRTYGPDYHNLLYFDEEFLATLPLQDHSYKDVLEAELLDTVTGLTHPVKVYAVYEQGEYIGEDSGWETVQAWSLHDHMYASHWCGCHRIDSIEGHNPGVRIDPPPESMDDEHYCPKGRFVCLRVWPPGRPDVVLYSEPKT